MDDDLGGDVRELMSTAAGLWNGLDTLHDAYMVDRDKNPGKLPVVVLSRTIDSGSASNPSHQPVFSISEWVPRPAQLPLQGIPSSQSAKKKPAPDVRGDGGYVLAPPSVHPSGKCYEWSVDSADTFATAPSWLLSAAAKPSAANGAAVATPATEWHELIKGAAEGTRDNTITRLAGYLLRRRIDPLMALALLQSWNATSCAPPLPDEDIARIVNSIAGKELRRRGGFGR
jgi:hypothetical protein